MTIRGVNVFDCSGGSARLSLGFPMIQSPHPLQRMIRSARYNISGAMVSPRALATFRLMTNSILLFTSTGISAGSAPLRILSTRRAAGRPDSY